MSAEGTAVRCRPPLPRHSLQTAKPALDGFIPRQGRSQDHAKAKHPHKKAGQKVELYSDKC